ncbi:MAG: hypothetical protein HGA65_14315 [Oscillochloris sp.]|nr:hypothetical protein [Oscillochloris sp.]
MDAYTHARISVQHWGGQAADYFPIHAYIDSTKELCSDNRHRILHTLWGVRRVVLPIFGPAIINSDGRTVNVKDICERDHILPDYQNRFIPTLADFVQAIAFPDTAALKARIDTFHQRYAADPAITELLLSPLAVTGRVSALLITHNSWFVNAIIPQILGRPPQIMDFALDPRDLFTRMRFELWMDNGAGDPPSAAGVRRPHQE